MSIQGKFRTFDENIKLRRFSENAELVQKRERVLNRLREGLESRFPYRNERPTFDFFNQGSYEMGTGIMPIDGDYDIDVAVVFDVKKHKHDPHIVKGWVHSAVEAHTSYVPYRRPCVTAYYMEDGQPRFHVDLAVYAKGDFWGGPYLAFGKEHSKDPQWVESDPKGLIRAIESRWSGEEARQFRRVIRFLKRWKDLRFSTEGQAAPRGIALTICAYKWFEPTTKWSWRSWEDEPSDLRALLKLVQRMIDQFSIIDGRLRVKLPVTPGTDIFKRMTPNQMTAFRGKLVELRDMLRKADSASEDEACSLIRTHFGDAFPA